jgi:hypothetical protein
MNVRLLLLCFFVCALALPACKGGEVEVPLMVQESATAEGVEAYKKCVKKKPGDWGEVGEEDWPKECEEYIMARYGTFE